MPKICYQDIKFSAANLAVINHANRILSDYDRQGYILTLRQLYYRFVATGLLDQLGFRTDASGSTNNVQSYKRLGSIVNDGRLCGLIDWSYLEDRTRNLHKLPSWDSPQEIIRGAASQFRIDKWADQPRRVEIWVEKDALAGVIQPVCDTLQVPFFSCRGYTSQSEMWAAGQRLKQIAEDGQEPIIFHFGDHDPSGMDMSRDITDRLSLFTDGAVELQRLALNMDQINEYDPPANPAKITDSRAAAYIRVHGAESWELDALEPDVLAALVRRHVLSVRDPDLWVQAELREETQRDLLGKVSENWEEIAGSL